MSDQLLPCPFCGHDEPTHDEGDQSAWVQCTNLECGMCGPIATGPSLAAAAWNRRATQSVAGEPVFQLRNPKIGPEWHEVDGVAYEEFASMPAYERRTLWTAPAAAAPVTSNDPALVGALIGVTSLSRALRQGGPAPEDLQELSDALEEAVAIAHDAVAGLPDPDAAIRSIVHERQRQIEGEGWTPERDDQYQQGELAKAAAGYVLHVLADQSWKSIWPFAPQWFKPADPRRMLVKAGALVVAEIQRIDRAEARAQEAAQ